MTDFAGLGPFVFDAVSSFKEGAAVVRVYFDQFVEMPDGTTYLQGVPGSLENFISAPAQVDAEGNVTGGFFEVFPITQNAIDARSTFTLVLVQGRGSPHRTNIQGYFTGEYMMNGDDIITQSVLNDSNSQPIPVRGPETLDSASIGRLIQNIAHQRASNLQLGEVYTDVAPLNPARPEVVGSNSPLLTRANRGNIINVLGTLVTGGDGSDAHPWTGWGARIDASPGGEMFEFPSGTVALSNAINWAKNPGNRYYFNKTKLLFTGSGVCLNLVGGSYGTVLEGGLEIVGNVNATIGMNLDSIFNATIRDIMIHDVTQYGLQLRWNSENTFEHVRVSKNQPFNPQVMPATGLYSVTGAGGNQRNTFTECAFEGLGQYGGKLEEFHKNTFNGCTFEENGIIGLWLTSTATLNHCVGTDNEDNDSGGNRIDFLVEGNSNHLEGVYATGRVYITGSFNEVDGEDSYINILQVAGGVENLLNCDYHETFADVGTRTMGRVRNMRVTNPADPEYGKYKDLLQPVGKMFMRGSAPGVLSLLNDTATGGGSLELDSFLMAGVFHVTAGFSAPTGSTPHPGVYFHLGGSPCLYVYESGAWVGK